MKIRVDSGTYTFVTAGPSVIDVLRDGKPWIALHDGTNAIRALLSELDAARVVLAAARHLGKDPLDIGTIPDEREVLRCAFDYLTEIAMSPDAPLLCRPHPLHQATDPVVLLAAAYTIAMREIATLRAALVKHNALVDDTEPPSEWTR